MSSYIFTLSGNDSVLTTQIHPAIELDPKKTFVLGFIAFFSYNSIPNVDSSNNKFYYEDGMIELPEGAYELHDIEKNLQNRIADLENKKIKQMKKRQESSSSNSGRALQEDKTLKFTPTSLSVKANNNTLRCEIKCNKNIDFSKEGTIGSLLGFKKQFLSKFQKHISEEPVNIFTINSIQIECNLIANSYSNNSQVHILHSFYPSAPPGFKIIEQPGNIIYLPINTRFISEIVLKISDQYGKLINFKKELITVRLHLKELS